MFTGPLFQVKLHLLDIVLLSGFQSHWVRQYLVCFMGLVGRVSTKLYKTKPIFNTSQSWKIVLIFTLHMQYKLYWTVFHLNLTVYDWFQQINSFHHMPAYNGKLLFGGHTILSNKCQLPVLSVSVACIGYMLFTQNYHILIYIEEF